MTSDTAPKPPGRITEVVQRYLAGRDWPSEEVAPGVFALPVAGTNGSWHGYIEAREAESQLLVHSVLPLEVPESRRTAIALYLTRANFGLVIGNFEMDLDGTEVRFKTSADLADVDLTETTVDHLLLAGVVTCDRYLPGLHHVLDGAEPETAIGIVEKP